MRWPSAFAPPARDERVRGVEPSGARPTQGQSQSARRGVPTLKVQCGRAQRGPLVEEPSTARARSPQKAGLSKRASQLLSSHADRRDDCSGAVLRAEASVDVCGDPGIRGDTASASQSTAASHGLDQRAQGGRRHDQGQNARYPYLDEVFLTINGKRHYLWRAVDQDDNVLDILVQSRQHKQAAKKFFRKLLKGCSTCHASSSPISSRATARRSGRALPGVEHRQSRYLNNRCENSHRPTRHRSIAWQGLNQGVMRHGFSPRTVRLLSTFDPGGICSQRRRTAKRCDSDSRVGPKLPVRSGPPKGWGGPRRGPRLPDERLSLNNLTKPS